VDVREGTGDRLVVDQEPVRVRITSEPYLILTKLGYQPAVDLILEKSKRRCFLYISASSIAKHLEELRIDNKGVFFGLEFWIRKSGPDRRSPYVVD